MLEQVEKGGHSQAVPVPSKCIRAKDRSFPLNMEHQHIRSSIKAAQRKHPARPARHQHNRRRRRFSSPHNPAASARPIANPSRYPASRAIAETADSASSRPARSAPAPLPATGESAVPEGRLTRGAALRSSSRSFSRSYPAPRNYAATARKRPAPAPAHEPAAGDGDEGTACVPETPAQAHQQTGQAHALGARAAEQQTGHRSRPPLARFTGALSPTSSSRRSADRRR